MHDEHHNAGRNDLCPCGSGKKYKKCCELKQADPSRRQMMLIVVGLLVAAGVTAGDHRDHQPIARMSARPGGVWSPEHGHYH